MAKLTPECGRLSLEAYLLRIGEKILDVDQLNTWLMWDTVVQAVQQLDPPITPEETDWLHRALKLRMPQLHDTVVAKLTHAQHS